MRADRKAKQFFFINKSENSAHLSRSPADEKSAVQRHVQTGRKRSRLARQAKPAIDERTNHPSQRGGHASEEADTDRLVNNPFKDPEGSQPDCARLPRKLRNCAPDLNSQRILCKQDPFDAACIPINNRVGGLLHYYLHFYHPSQWPNEMILLRQGLYMFQDTVTNNMRNAIADRLTMYCLLSAASCRLQFVDRLPSRLVAGSEKYYIYKSLQAMTARINAGGIDNIEHLQKTISCMVFLNSAEAYRGDMVAAKTHLNAAVRLLEPMGGIKILRDDGLQGQLAMADLFLACVNLQSCSFDSSYDPGPASSLGLSRQELQKPSSPSTASLLLTQSRDLMIPELEILVEELVESHNVKSRIKTSIMPPARAMQVTHWITLRNMAIRNKLLALQTTNSRIHALRTAIIMWTLLAMNVTGRAKTVKVMAPKLREVMHAVPADDWANFEQMKLWIVLIGYYCAAEESEASEWFSVECGNLIHTYMLPESFHYSVSSLVTQLEAFQLRFFYDIPVQRARTHVIVARLMTTFAEATDVAFHPRRRSFSPT